MLELQQQIKAGSRTLLISAIDGTAGVGKSTLQIHLAHRVVRSFPDAQLYANLRGGDDDAAPVPPLVVLKQFLQSLGEPRPPRTVEAAAVRYRSLLDGKRALILLDNAFDEAQVRPLLPGSGSCTVVITSRSRLEGLEATQSCTLRVFTKQEAVALLTRIVGSELVAADREHTEEVVQHCGGLPLALRIAGSRLKHGEGWTMELLATKLADERQRLDTLTTSDLGVRASFLISYHALSDIEKRLFRLAAVPRTQDLPYEAAASAAGAPMDAACKALDRLIQFHLIEVGTDGATLPRRTQFHDLLRLFAHERSGDEDDDSSRQSALGRVLAWYQQQLDAGRSSERAWLEQQLENLIALTEQASGLPGPLRSYTWQLATALAPDLERFGELGAWETTARLAVDAAEAGADVAVQATTLTSLGCLHTARGELATARSLLTRAERRLRHTDQPRSLAQVKYHLAGVLRQLGQLELAHRAAAHAYRLLTDLATTPGALEPGTRECLTELGDIAAAQNDHSRAIAHFRAARSDDTPSAHILARLGAEYRALGRRTEAVAAFEDAAEQYRRDGDRGARATVLEELGLTHDAAGNPRAAAEAYRRSRALYRELQQPADQCRLLGTEAANLHRQGRTDEAITAFRETIRVARDTGMTEVQRAAQLNLGEILLAEGDPRSAMPFFRQARDGARRAEDHAGLARALLALTRAQRSAGTTSRSRSHVAQLNDALRSARLTGDQSLVVRVLIDLGLAHRDRNEWQQAKQHLTSAVRTARDPNASDPVLLGLALMYLGAVESTRDSTDSAAARLTEAVDHFRAGGARELAARTLMYLGRIHREGANPSYPYSLRSYEAAAELWNALGDHTQEAHALAGQAVAQALTGLPPTVPNTTLARAATLAAANDAALVDDIRDWTADGRRNTLPALPW
ncbi:tetratricopeptide repeat protein [Streptomyces sp. NPDC048442]|uniref:tetratricopeptide repeat protein n=1 Tax=Streptomyces sp. NPDC048442 TaxID=3154823 RepID=UPI003412B4CA